VSDPPLALSRRVRLALRRFGLDVHRYRPEITVDVRRLRFLRDRRIDTVVDGGANEGQWAQELRRAGYKGSIISFEPVAQPFALLAAAAHDDPRWLCVKAALGAAETEALIHVAGNSLSSSLLPMGRTHLEAAPKSAYVGTERVRVVRLDEALEDLGAVGGRVAIKLDLQGFEAQALEGAAGLLGRVHLFELELSTVSLYDGQPLYREMIDLMNGLGFSLASVAEEMIDPADGRVLQLNGLFVRSREEM
jgi:FkbM family methyltransferase